MDATSAVMKDVLAYLYASGAPAKAKGMAFVQAHDGTYLGSVDAEPDSAHSLLNPYGPFGSEFSPRSMFNPDSEYGRLDGKSSAWNPKALTPPRLVIHNKVKGIISANEDIKDRITPEDFSYTLEIDTAGLSIGKLRKAPAKATGVRLKWPKHYGKTKKDRRFWLRLHGQG